MCQVTYCYFLIIMYNNFKFFKEKVIFIKIYKIIFNILSILASLSAIVSLYISLLVRQDTAELSKFSDKPIYYSINLYPNENTKDAVVNEKYISMDLTLIVDDFIVNKKNFMSKVLEKKYE